MKIGFIEPHLELYGGIRRVVELANRLVAMGDEVTIYHPAGTSCRWMLCKARIEPLSQLLEDTHDAVIFNDPPHYTIAKRSKAHLKVFYLLGLYERERLREFSVKIFWPKKGRALLLRRALRFPFLKITNATWMHRYLEEELGVECELVLGGVNRDFFHPVSVAREPGTFKILCTGDPREFKGTKTVFEAFEILKEDFPNIFVESYYGKNIPQKQMAATYSSADVFVDAQWEAGCGWNNPVAEAMACKVPVVCTDIGGVEDFAVNEETALLVPPRNPLDLAKAISRIISDGALRARLRENAFRRIGRFDWDRSASRLREVLEIHLARAAGSKGQSLGGELGGRDLIAG